MRACVRARVYLQARIIADQHQMRDSYEASKQKQTEVLFAVHSAELLLTCCYVHACTRERERRPGVWLCTLSIFTCSFMQQHSAVLPLETSIIIFQLSVILLLWP